MATTKRRTVIISGGCGDIGRAVGKKLSEDGCDVIALYHSTPQNETEALLKTFTPGNHAAFRCDLNDPFSIADIVEKTLVEHQRIDACVHAAVNPILRRNILETSGEELKEQLSTGFWGGFSFLKTIGAHMKENHSGIMIGVLSRAIQPEAPHSRMAGYAIGKYALRGLLRELHEELSSSSVMVSAIAPDFMDTALNKDLPPAIRSFIIERAVTGSIASPDDAARAISFLCSPEGQAAKGKIFSFDQKEIMAL